MGEAHHGPPGLPEVRDEARETPVWVPVLGLALLALMALTLVVRSAPGNGATTEVEPVDVETAPASDRP